MKCTQCEGCGKRIITPREAMSWLAKHPDVMIYFPHPSTCQIVKREEERQWNVVSTTEKEPDVAFCKAVGFLMFEGETNCPHCKGTGYEPVPSIEEALQYLFDNGLNYQVSTDIYGHTLTIVDKEMKVVLMVSIHEEAGLINSLNEAVLRVMEKQQENKE